MATAVVNPYHPDQPSPPEFFSGRAAAIDDFREAFLEGLQDGEPSSFLITGERGIGKSSLLRKLRSVSDGLSSEALCVEVSIVAASASPSEFVSTLAAEVKNGLRSKSSRFAKFEAALRRVNALGIGPVSFGTSPAADTARQAQALWRQIAAELTEIPITLFQIDNGELLTANELECLKMITETETPSPVALVVAGAPALSERLLAPEAGHIGRIFTQHRVPLVGFTPEETERALTLPHPRLGGSITWEPAAIEFVQWMSGGSPYLVQCFGHAAFREDSGHVDEARVRSALSDALELARPAIGGRLSRLGSAKLRGLARWAAEGLETVEQADLRRFGVDVTMEKSLLLGRVLRRTAPNRFALRPPPAAVLLEAIDREIQI